MLIATVGVGRGCRGGKAPPRILKISAKNVVFLISGGKNKFHHFWPHLEKFWKNPLVAPLEKILPMPMITTMSYSKFESIQLQREESAEKFNESRKMLFIL